MEEFLSLEHISKIYPGVVALNDVSISFRQGEVHALMGANGAGKSTLMKLLSGAERPSAGTISFLGNQYTALTPAQSIDIGIGTVYQEHNLVDSLPVMENVFIGNWPGSKLMVNKKEMRVRTKALLEEFGIHIAPDTPVGNLSPAMQQIIEITKTTSRELKVLILDEPTAPLTVSEVEILFNIVRKVKAKGITVIYISHRMEEIFSIADRVSVLRDGEYIGTREVAELDRDELIGLMVGKGISNDYPPPLNDVSREVTLEADAVTGNGVSGISFQLHRGEILGFAGLVGCGRSELMSVLFGDAKLESGSIKINGKPAAIHCCRDAIRCGVGLIPEDRKNAGLLLENSVSENITLASLPAISRLSVVSKKKERDIVSRYCEQLQIKTPSKEQLVKRLSGGNQQKVVLAKWLATQSDILIFDEPTRGIDVAAKQEIYKLMRELAAEGKSIIMVSSDTEELLGISDRIIVLCEGEMTGELSKEEFDTHRILDLASGKR